MHELSIAMSILDAVQEEVDRHGYPGIEAVHLRVGDLSGVVPGALSAAYEMAAEMTPFAGSRLVIETVPVVIHCARCACDRPVDTVRVMCCPECGDPSNQLVQGRELEVQALEVSS
ncbi:MAG TPA: hydrogenase maturation nickel metallochaperone HypA [Bryobacteraceae bacterium]|jgi:hydrogenase nickel incorporation protein HypA/HybF|nr:hydrogenase maturation nickel metallochaperone HypA [Bryobacteraceae bacterium]